MALQETRTMAISVRLDAQTEEALAEAAAAKGLTKSDFIRLCVTDFLARQEPRARAWDLGHDLFGKAGSGRKDLSKNRKPLVREKIHASKDRH
jgi:hypothetical protein